MAQDYVGSNNINFLQPSGQFGTRNLGGKDHASARYIFTCLSPITRFLFPKDDDRLLDYMNEDGQSIEPTWYVPVIPTVLVNGSEGIGTGWSSYIPNYNPRDIVANVRRMLNDEEMVPMDPWYRGFTGVIEKSQKTVKEIGMNYTACGIIEEVDETTLRISELPIRRWTQDYKEFLDSISQGNDKAKDPFIDRFTQHSDHSTVEILVHLPVKNLIAAKKEGFLKKFKLTTSINTTNMHLFDTKGAIKKYETPEQILEEFFHLRLEFYGKRKKVLLENLELELLKLENKVRFILGVVNGEIIVSNRKRADLFNELHHMGFTPFPKKAKSMEPEVAGASDNTEETEENETVIGSGVRSSDYEYLISMAIGTLTIERVGSLLADREKVNLQVTELRGSTLRSLWLKDLDVLDTQLDELEKTEALADDAKRKSRNNQIKNAPIGKLSKQAPKPRKNAKNTSNAETVADSRESSSGSAMDIEQAAPKRAPAKKDAKSTVTLSDEEEEILDLKDRLAAYNLDSSPDKDIEVPAKAAHKRTPNKKTAPTPHEDDEDNDFEVEVVAVPPSVTKGRRKPAGTSKAAAASKPPVAAKKRGPAVKKEPKTSSVLSRINVKEEMNASEEKWDAPVAAVGRARPQRTAAQSRKMILVSDTEDDDSVEEAVLEDSESDYSKLLREIDIIESDVPKDEKLYCNCQRAVELRREEKEHNFHDSIC
ncbi:hypothetical protein OROGR_003741 [Orobanche gracilis]